MLYSVNNRYRHRTIVIIPVLAYRGRDTLTYERCGTIVHKIANANSVFVGFQSFRRDSAYLFDPVRFPTRRRSTDSVLDTDIARYCPKSSRILRYDGKAGRSHRRRPRPLGVQVPSRTGRRLSRQNVYVHVGLTAIIVPYHVRFPSKKNAPALLVDGNSPRGSILLGSTGRLGPG